MAQQQAQPPGQPTPGLANNVENILSKECINDVLTVHGLIYIPHTQPATHAVVLGINEQHISVGETEWSQMGLKQ